MLKSRLFAASALAAGVALLPSIAWAQATVTTDAAAAAVQDPPAGTPDAVAAAEEAESDAAIVVTGSRIRSPNLESTVPVSVVQGEAFFETGQVAIGDVLNDLPQLRSTFSQQNSTRFLGTRGISLLDLRGLGSQRTLVLVNGRRHVASDILVNGVSPDINTFPTDLIDRVDIVTGGNSSIYGSDAIAGVVNFVLKDNFDGLTVRGQSGISQYGDAGNQYVSVLAGRNFAEDRGNIAINLEFAHQSRYFGSGRPNLRQNDAFIVTEADTGADVVNGAKGTFDRTFFRDIRSATISLGGQLGFRYAAGGPCGNDATGAAFTCGFLFQPDGSLVSQTGTRVGLAPNGNYIGGNGTSSREGQLLTLTPDLKRYSANLIGHFEFAPAAVAFVEAKYVRAEAFGSQSGPFFSQGQTLADAIAIPGFTDRSYVNGGAGANREGIRLDNPYLSAAARATIASQLTAAINSGVNPNTGTAYGTTAAGVANRNAALAQVANGSFRFSNRRNYVDFGIRDEQIRRETYRIVGGLRGDFNDDWRYEVSLNYGEYKERNFIQSNVNRQRFLLANDTVRNAAGQIVCRSQVDPNYAVTIANATGTTAAKAAILAADVAACVPINPFGQGSVSQAARDYVTVSSEATGKITQFVASGFVAGDLSQLFELPGGPIAFSLGGEYRRETNAYDLDDLTQAGYAFYNAIPEFSSPSFKVKEAFGEIRIPLIKDVPLLQELTISGSGRIADYRGATGTVYAYSGGVDWRPIRDLRLRGNYSRAVRAPNLSELFSAQSQNFAPAPNDPCSARNLNTGSATRIANCNAAGRPANYDFVYTSSLEIISGGNPDLREETSDSYTVGGVFTPSFIPGLSLSVDYYKITVDNVITSVTAQQILNLCYDSPDLNNQFCALIQRAPAAGGPRGEQQFRVLEGTLLASTLNFAKFKASGIDTNLNYQHTFDFGKVSLNAIWTHALKRENYTNPTDPSFKDIILSELGDPSDQVNLEASFKRGKVTFGYQVRWIDRMYLNTFEDYNSVNGQPPQNADYAPIKKYPDVYYHDARVAFDVSDRFNAYVGVDNIGNRKPPFGLTGVGAGSGIYDTRGRYGYVGVVAKF